MTDTTERSGFVYMHKLLKQLLILLLCTVLIGTGFSPASVSAASRPVTISSCKNIRISLLPFCTDSGHVGQASSIL